MKRKILVFIVAFAMVTSQLPYVYGAEISEKQKVFDGSKDVPIILEKESFLKMEKGYCDRFLISGALKRGSNAFKLMESAEKAFETAKECKTALEQKMENEIEHAKERQEFAYMVEGEKAELSEDDILVQEFYETAERYKILELPEKIEPEVFIEKFLREVGNEDIYIQPDYVVELAAEEIDFEETDTYEGNTKRNLTKESQGSILEYEADVEEAWKYSEGEGVTVALLDTGVDVSHPDLVGHMLEGYDFVNESEKVYDAALGMEQSHGTHIAGIIAKAAPKAKVLPLKVFENGNAYTSDIIQAIAYAKEHGASIVNMSFGGTDNNQALREAMEESGLFFVCAAGNSRLDLGKKPIYPAAFSLDNSISVGALNEDMGLAYFSNYGDQAVDIAAWGRGIYGCFPGGTYGKLDGTSIAAGYVSAAAALAAATDENIILKERLKSTADRLSCLKGKIIEGNKLSFSGTVCDISNKEMTEVVPEEDFDETEALLTPTEEWELFSSKHNVAIAAGSRHALALKEDGTVWTWGSNEMGELGNNTTVACSYQPVRVIWTNGVSAISAGGMHNAILKKDGTVYTWGANTYGQLGNGKTTNSKVPVRVTISSDYGKITAISAGEEHCLAITENGKVLSWGSNSYGALGDGTETDRTTPVEVVGLSNIIEVSAGSARSMALDRDGNVWAWGKDVPGHVEDETGCVIPVKITFDGNIKGLSTGFGDNSAILSGDDGVILGWGRGYAGSDGVQEHILEWPCQINGVLHGELEGMTALSIGGSKTVALHRDGTVFVYNAYTELPDGSLRAMYTTWQLSGGVQAIASGNDFTVLLKNDGTIMTEGNNCYGQCAQSQNVASCSLGEVAFYENLSFNTAKPMSIDEDICGELVTSQEYRYYSFVPPMTMTYSFESIAKFDTYGELYNSEGVRLQYNDDGKGAGESTNNGDFYIKQELTGGETYYLVVSSYHTNYAGAYTVKVKFWDACGNDIQHATQIEEGFTKGNIDYSEDIDMYQFVPTKTGFYEIQSVSSYGVLGTLYNYVGIGLDSNSSGNGQGVSGNVLDFYMYDRLIAGETYYISVQKGRYNLLQEYDLKVSYKDDYGNDRDTAMNLQNGACLNCEIDYAGDIDMFRFVPEITASYVMESISSFDTYGILYDASGNQITYNNDGRSAGESTNDSDFYIKYPLEANKTYYIAVKAYSPLDTGSYVLKAEWKDDYGGVMSLAYDISERYMTEGEINYIGDTDAFMFMPQKDGRYILSTTGNTELKGILLTVDANENTTAMNPIYEGANVKFEIDLEAEEKSYLMLYNRNDSVSNLGDYKVYIETPLSVVSIE